MYTELLVVFPSYAARLQPPAVPDHTPPRTRMDICFHVAGYCSLSYRYSGIAFQRFHCTKLCNIEVIIYV